MAGCLLDIGKSIITQCLLPRIKIHFDYWWCFDNNIQGLINEAVDLERIIYDINQKIEEARLRTETLRPGVEDWANSGSEKLAEARRFLLDVSIPKAWNIISRYSMGKWAKKAAEEIAKHRNDGNFYTISDPAPPPAMRFIPMDFESRKWIEEKIIQSLRSSSVSMIGICGVGGIGKTTMAKRIMTRVMEENLFDEVVMVVVSQPINMSKIQKEIAELLGLKFDVECMSARADKLRKRLMDSKRKIIIFDDVWEILKLEELGIPFESGFERCKVLMTSRSRDTYKGIKIENVFELKILEAEEAWILFKENAGECVEDSALLFVAKEVATECKGLPIALVTVAKSLKNITNKYIWKDSLSQLRQGKPTDFPEVLTDVYNPLKLSYNPPEQSNAPPELSNDPPELSNDPPKPSYDHLENESQRNLFLLCCLFPEDYDIPVEQLTLYSMGLRLFKGISSIGETRNRTHTLVEKLKSSSFLVDSRKDLHVRMHDVVRDVGIYIGSEEKNGFLKSLNKTSIKSSSDVNCNWMSVDISIPVALSFPKLRLLMLLESSDENISFEGMKGLNVLSFSSTRIESLPSMLGLLQNLRTLYLYDCTVENISVIGESTSLEVFSCNECGNIKELPAEMKSLNCLRLLELNKCRNLQRIPFGILSSLVKLEELKIRKSFDGWEAEENGKEMRNASIKELECLRKLTCLEIEISDSNLAAQEIRLQQKLAKYKIYIASEDDWFEERGYEKVMNLNLPSDIGAVGNWIPLLRSTESLFLEGDGSNNINLEECQLLRNLKYRKCSRVKKLVKTKDCEFGIVFRLLESLNLWGLDKLEEIFDDPSLLKNVSLCNLKSVVITRCSNLRTLFSVSMAQASLLQLEVLEIRWCDKMERVFWNDRTDDSIEFPKLKTLTLRDLPNLTAFCQRIKTIKFPKLTEMVIEELPKLNSLCPLNSETPHDDRTSFHFLCNQKVEIDGLEILSVRSCFNNNFRNIWCHQIPFNLFQKLQKFEIWRLNGIRSLMSYSIAKNLKSLKSLHITSCVDMVEVIEDIDNEDDKKELLDNKCFFPTLKTLEIIFLPKLKRFSQWNKALELPLLEYVIINGCPVMETFTMGSLTTPNLKRSSINWQEIDDVKDLNDRHHFRTKVETSTSGSQFCADGLRWQPDVESAFIDVLYEEVLKGNLLSSTFTTHVWNEIKTELHKRTGYDFSVKRMRQKLGRIKGNWRKYKKLMLSDTELSWDNDLDLPVASPVWWAEWEKANPQSLSLRTKPCRGYVKLCSVFSRNTATDSRARSSAQIPPVPDNGDPSTLHDEFIDLDGEDDTPLENDPLESVAMMSSSSKRRKSKKEMAAFNRLCDSIQTTNESFSSKLNEKRKEQQCKDCLAILRSLPDVSVQLISKASRYFEKEERRLFFLSMNDVERRDYLDNIPAHF